MAIALAVITILMLITKKMPKFSISELSNKSWRIIALALFLPAIALFHAALVSALLALGFISAADALSYNNPNVAEAQAQKSRAIAIDMDESNERNQILTESLEYWQQGISARPLWPYYHLGALDVEVLLKDQAASQQRIQHIIELAPNERGLDQSFMILAFIAWNWLEAAEKEWVLQRLSISSKRILKEVFFYAKQANNQQDICAHLAWNKVKKLCSAH